MSDITRDYSFGGWLREERIKKNLTLRKMAEALGMNAGNYCKIEKSELDPPSSKKAVIKLLKPLQLDMLEDFMVSLAYQHHLAKFKEKWSDK